MDRMDYIQAVTRTRVLETRLLSRARLERMVDAKDMEEVFKVLGETEYANVMGGLTRDEEYEKILSSELKRVYKLMYEIARDRVVVDLLALKYDYHNLKVLIKEKLLQRDFEDMYISIGSMDFSKVKMDYLAGNFRDMDPKVREAIEEVEKDLEINEDPQRIDILLDKYYFEHLYKLAESTDIPLFIDYVKDLIDLTNIRTLIRVKKQNKDIKFLEEVVVPHGKIGKDDIVLALNDSTEGIAAKFKSFDVGPDIRKGLEAYQESNRLSEFEKLMDDYLMDINKPSKFVNFGPEPIFSYVLAKETEIKALRIIMVSKLNKLSPEDIRERLRDLYV
ncbi:MAG: V-type ATP synthase subunit C [Tissierellaceae bacterium]|nr:V-type ATP synthase subunit C [Tissierellaceae bacterium]